MGHRRLHKIPHPQIFGLLFNLGLKAIRDIFNDFDVSGDQELDYGEFKLFAMACIDRGKSQKQKSDDKIGRISDSISDISTTSSICNVM